MTRNRFLAGLGSATLGISLTLSPASIAADLEPSEPNDTTGPGIAGGILLGAEVVLLAEAAFGIKNPWAYTIGGIVGGAGGGVGGYYASRDNREELPVFLLAGGIVLIIPTVVAVLSASAYEPPGPESAALVPQQRLAPPALLDIADERVQMGVPAVAVRDLYTKDEVSQFGETQGTEVQVPMLNVAF